MTPSLNTSIQGDVRWRHLSSSQASTHATTANQSQFFKQRASSQLKAVDKVYQRADDIQKNMISMEQKLKEFGHVQRKSGNQSMLTKHKPANSVLFGASDIDESLRFASNIYGERVQTAQVG
jgi:hypothetical protein